MAQTAASALQWGNNVTPSTTDPEQIARLMSQRIGIPHQTETWVAAFNSAMQLLRIEKFCDGELSPSPPTMNLLLNYLLKNEARNFVVAKADTGHAFMPSADDLELAAKLSRLFYQVGYTMVDYVIINESSILLTSEFVQ